MGISVYVIEEAVSADREELHMEAGEIAVDGGAFGTGWLGGVAGAWSGMVGAVAGRLRGEWGCGCC